MKNLENTKSYFTTALRSFGRVLSLIVVGLALSASVWGTSKTMYIDCSEISGITAMTKDYLQSQNNTQNPTVTITDYVASFDFDFNYNDCSTADACKLKYKFKITVSGTNYYPTQENLEESTIGASNNTIKITLVDGIPVYTYTTQGTTTTVPTVYIGNLPTVEDQTATINLQMADWGCANVDKVKIYYTTDHTVPTTSSYSWDEITLSSVISSNANFNVTQNVSASGTYTIAVMAHNSEGYGALSDTASFTIEAGTACAYVGHNSDIYKTTDTTCGEATSSSTSIDGKSFGDVGSTFVLNFFLMRNTNTYSNGKFYYSVDDGSFVENDLALDGDWTGSDYRYKYEMNVNTLISSLSLTPGSHTVKFYYKAPADAEWLVKKSASEDWTFTFNAPGVTNISPASPFDFGNVVYGQNASQEFTFNSYGTDDLTAEIVTGGSSDFTVTASSNTAATVKFTPTLELGAKEATLRLTRGGKSVDVALSGTCACVTPTAAQYPMAATALNCGATSIEIPVSSGAGTVSKTYYKKTSEESSAYTETFPSEPGTYNVKIDVNAGTTYCSATGIELTNTLTLNALSRTIGFDDISARCGAGTYTITATASAGEGTKTFEKVSGDNASITSAGVLTLNGAGAYSLKVTIAASGCYASASVTAEFAAATLPTLTTSSVTGLIKKTTAIGVTGNVSVVSGCTPSEIGIVYKRTSVEESWTKQKDGSKTSGDISVTLTGLIANTGYTYKTYATVNGVDIFGSESTFTTCSDPASVTATGTLNKGKGYPWEQGKNSSGESDPTYKGYFGTNADQRTVTLETSTETNYYQWYTCKDAQGTNPAQIEGASSSNLTRELTQPGTYFFLVKAGCDAADVASSVVTVEVPYPEMGIYGPGIDGCSGWTESYASGDGKLTTPTSGNEWTGTYTISSNSDKQFIILQRHKVTDCVSENDGWCSGNNITVSSTSLTAEGCTISGANVTPDAATFSSGDKVKITVTMTSPTAYKVKLQKLYKFSAAVKSYYNDQYELYGSTSDKITVSDVEYINTSYTDYYAVEDLPKSYTLTATPATDDNVNYSVFLGWSNNPSGSVSLISGAGASYTYTIPAEGEHADVTLYAHFAAPWTEASSNVMCTDYTAKGSMRSYAAGIALPGTVKISVDGGAGQTMDGTAVTTWTQTESQFSKSVTVTSGVEHSNVLQYIYNDVTYVSAENVKTTTDVAPEITPSATTATQYTPVTLSTEDVETTTWAITSPASSNAYLSATTGESVIFKGPSADASTSQVYDVTATGTNGCTTTQQLTITPDTEDCSK